MEVSELVKSIKEAQSLLAILQPSAAPAPAQESGIPSGPYIIVLDRGWVYQSNAVRQEGSNLYLENAQVIRSWGTERGLGQLTDGPLTNTKLDPAGLVIAPMKSVIHLIACRSWK